MDHSSQHLFTDFAAVSSKQWKQLIQYELKGADYNETLVWESPEGIKVKPFYHGDDTERYFASADSGPFLVCQDIFVFDLEKSIWRANDSLSRGAQSLRFTIPAQQTDIGRLIASLPSGPLTLYFDLPFLSIDFIKALDKALEGKHFTVFASIDPIGHLVSDGNWMGKSDDFEALKKLSAETKNLSIFSVYAKIYQNAGANLVQQLAYTLGHATEYFHRIPIDKPILFQIAVGPNYFFEIAKLRALRVLVSSVAKEFGIAAEIHILATPSRRNKTLYDYNVNMLRSTTECMSAILGGADAVSNLPYDAIYHKSNEFGERISRNQLLIMKEESYLDAVSNPADGSYYIESLTEQLAEKALVLFKEIEAAGGFLAQLKDGTIQRKVRESAEKEQQAFDSGAEILIGTNKHPNKADKMKDELELFPFVKHKPRKTLITPIVEKRLAEKSEQQRLDAETNHNQG